MEETPYWLGFHLVPGIGATRLARLIEHFGSLSEAWHASTAALRTSGLTQRAAEALVATRTRISLDVEMERVDRAGAEVVTLADDRYPPRLREISSPPTVLYVRGSLDSADEHAIGVVGTRRATAYGREMTRRLCFGLGQAGVTIVSGLARGIDGVAHTTALEVGARTIAVLGCGFDTIYPPEHRGLADRIIEQGALVSEFPLGTPPDAANFPIRNRLISGLSLGVIVVEAPRRSGALITANFAADQGRTVYAVPGSALTPTSEGTLQLLRDGATLAAVPDDVLADLQLSTRQAELEVRRTFPTTAEERDVLGLLSGEPRHVDELALELGIAISQLSALLLQMQLKGYIRDVGAHHYVRA
jgi:DNA processing protein